MMTSIDLMGVAIKNFGGVLGFRGFILIWGVFLSTFRLLQQDQIQFGEGLNSEYPQIRPSFTWNSIATVIVHTNWADSNGVQRVLDARGQRDSWMSPQIKNFFCDLRKYFHIHLKKF